MHTEWLARRAHGIARATRGVILTTAAVALAACGADSTAPPIDPPAKVTPPAPTVPAEPVAPVTPVAPVPPLEPDTIPLPTGVVSVTKLPSLGLGFTVASAIADNGMVTGYSATPTGYNHAFVWSAAGGIRDLGTLPGDSYSIGYDVNEAGQVVGFSGYQTPKGVVGHAFVWSASGGMKPIAGPGVESFATAINNKGEVVGDFDVGGSVHHAFVWSESTGLTDLGLLAGAWGAYAADINDSGTVVGATAVQNGIVPFVWSRSAGMRELPHKAGDGIYAVATTINAAGLIGGVDVARGETSAHAVVWAAGVERDLGSLGGKVTIVRAISPDGDVFGESDPEGSSYQQRAFVARPGRTMRDLSPRLPLNTIFGVNRHLQVVGDSLLVQLRREP